MLKNLTILCSILLFGSSLTAQETDPMRTDLLAGYQFAAGKVKQLAEAFPEDKYDWRPMEGVRSVKDAIVHVAAANFGLSARLGIELPEGIKPMELEKTVKDKKEAMDVLAKSVDQSVKAIKHVANDDMNTAVTIFGEFKGSKRRVMFIIYEHMNEHLGQLIAYARTNKIVPPWSKKDK